MQNARKNKRYTADFETTSIENYKRDGYVRVWAFDICDVETASSVLTGNNIDEFFGWVENLKNDTEIFFHNLKFDGTFIIEGLFKRGYIHINEQQKEHLPKTFTTLISSIGVWYEITIYTQYKKHINTIHIRDSLKKLPFSVDGIAKTFDLPISKLNIDYTAYRDENHVLTPDEINYIHNDTEIVARALKYQFNEGLTKMTIGADALSYFKDNTLGNAFNELYPILDNTLDNDLRQAYRGGFVYLNPKFKNKELTNVISYDVNSLYPSVMYDKPYPYGTPIHYNGKYKPDEKYPLYIQYIEVLFKIKPDHIPTIQLKNNLRFVPTEYITDSGDEPIILALTSIDLTLFLDHYDVPYIKYLEGFKFKQINGLFKKYIDKWILVKQVSTGGRRQLAKLMLNSLYGKFGTNPKHQQLIPTYRDGSVIYEHGPITYDTPVYVALACFVTAYARDKTIRTAQKVYDRFIYADTDSIHLIGTDAPEGLDIDPKRLGAWDYEGLATRAKFLRAKTYIKEKNGKIFVTCAGMPEKVKKDVNFDNFKGGNTFSGKLQAKKVQGGTLLNITEFSIKLDKH